MFFQRNGSAKPVIVPVLSSCYGFVLQGFGSGGAYRGGFCEKLEKLPPCLIQPVPAGSKTDTLLAKATPTSNGGSASGIMYLRKGRKKTAEMAVTERGVR